ncbi:MAG: hypothetical protein M9926_03320, partial [Lentimicrobium sp.]|uniref:hypothetical protein n=1 Tax=Lentimicrobium sp. TaxID=2034841 RepID=UPI0025CEC3C9
CTEPAEVAQRHQVAQIYFSHLVILSVFVSLWQILSSFYPDNGDLNIGLFNFGIRSPDDDAENDCVIHAT